MATAQEMLDKYIAAEQAVLDGQRVRFAEGGVERWLDMADLAFVQAGRREWERRVSSTNANAAGAATVGGLSYSVARLDGH